MGVMVHKACIADVKREYFSSEHKVTLYPKVHTRVYDFVDTMIAGLNFSQSFY